MCTSHLQHLRKGQKVYILPGVLNFQRVRNLLGGQLRSFQYAYYWAACGTAQL